MASPHDMDSQLRKLDASRDILEKLLMTSSSLESLRVGLESSLQLGQPLAELPVEALQLYHALGAKIKALCDAEVIERHKGLDLKVQKSLIKIVPIIAEFDVLIDSEDPVALLHLSEEVNKFKRLAKTAITLRILLYKRGIETEPLQLSVPEATVKQKLSDVEAKEAFYRNEVIETISVLEGDIKTLLANPGCSEDMQLMLKATLLDLAHNVEHIIEGLSIESLPVKIELVEIASDNKGAIYKDYQQRKPPIASAHNAEKRPTEEGVKPKLGKWQWLQLWIKEKFGFEGTEKKDT